MTGFGDASHQVDSYHYAVELRSLNNRYFKATIRLPEAILGLEGELEAHLRKKLSRGSITLAVRMYDSAGDITPTIHENTLAAYLKHIEVLQKKLSSANQNVSIDVAALLTLPGVLEPLDDEQTLIQKARPVLIGLTDQACGRLMTMRDTEGKAIADDLTKHRDVIHQRLDAVADRAPQVIEEYHQRLQKRIEEFVSRAGLEFEAKDLIHEVAVYAERADISEEVTRMIGHLEQFDEIIRSCDGEPAGRTLDFLAQELLREANTIASKSNDVFISRAIVDVKGAIDRIKEQVQNVE